jgi:hypothetical protein
LINDESTTHTRRHWVDLIIKISLPPNKKPNRKSPSHKKEKVRNERKRKKKLSQDDGEKREEEATVAHVCTVRSPVAY